VYTERASDCHTECAHRRRDVFELVLAHVVCGEARSCNGKDVDVWCCKQESQRKCDDIRGSAMSLHIPPPEGRDSGGLWVVRGHDQVYPQYIVRYTQAHTHETMQ